MGRTFVMMLSTLLVRPDAQLTCGTIKDIYKKEKCCGLPSKSITLEPFTSVTGVADCEKVVNAFAGVPGAMFPSTFCADHQHILPVGTRSTPIAEASDAGDNPSYLIDGAPGDIDWPHGALKVIATVGEINPVTGAMLTGVPDGQGAYLKDATTVTFMYQSESYGPLTRQETFPFFVNSGVGFTGSHVHFIDYDRQGLATYFDPGAPANAVSFVKDSGEAIKIMYNLKRQLVGKRNPDGRSDAPHHSNVDVYGNYIVAATPSKADWLMQSLCSAHLEVKHQWGKNMGLVDNLYITNEEWIMYTAEEGLVGLPAHVLNIATGELFATSAFTLGGFEKIVEVNTGTIDYVAFSPSGYNGAFGGSYPKVVAQRNGNYSRTDGEPYVWPQNICPMRLYLGKKNTDKNGQGNSKDFLARNGLEFGALYGFATDCSSDKYQDRDAWHKDPSRQAGDKLVGAFYRLRWTNSPGEVKDFVHDGSWEFQDAPEGAPAGWCFWNGAGRNVGGSKTEHNSPDPRGGNRVLQGSTAGYFGIYDFSRLPELLEDDDVDFPRVIPAEYTCLQPEHSIISQVILNGKGMYADGQNATVMPDKAQNPGKATFEDIDAVEWIAAKDGDYISIQEDGGNDFGERKFLGKVGVPMEYYFVAMSGGERNSRIQAGVSGVAASFKGPAGHEFSGATDLSGMLAKNAQGRFLLNADDATGARRKLEAETPIDEKIITVSLQAHSQWGGWTESFHPDATGQVYAYKPSLKSARRATSSSAV